MRRLLRVWLPCSFLASRLTTKLHQKLRHTLPAVQPLGLDVTFATDPGGAGWDWLRGWPTARPGEPVFLVVPSRVVWTQPDVFLWLCSWSWRERDRVGEGHALRQTCPHGLWAEAVREHLRDSTVLFLHPNNALKRLPTAQPLLELGDLEAGALSRRTKR